MTRRLSSRLAARLRTGDDSGNAIIEVIGLGVLVLIPLMYLLVAVFSVQSSAFGVTAAAREAGRAYVTASSGSEGLARAQYAAQVALQGQLPPEQAAAVKVWFTEGGSCGDGPPGGGSAQPPLTPGTSFSACASAQAPLPFANTGPLAKFDGAQVPVTARFVVVVDRYRSR